MNAPLKIASVLALLCLAGSTVASAGPCGTRKAENPVTGNQEKVWSEHDGTDYEIRWSEKVGNQWTNEISLTSNGADDTCPDMSVSSAGDTAVVWRESGGTGRIYYRGRTRVGGDWTWQSSSVAVSTGEENAALPRVRFDSKDDAVVAWHEALPGGDVKVQGGVSDSSPWPTGFTLSTITKTTFDDPIELDLNVENGHNWLAWIDSSAHLGFSERVDGEWGQKQQEPYSGPSDVENGKERIRRKVTNP